MQRKTERLYLQIETSNNMEEHNFSASRTFRFPVRGGLINQTIRGRLAVNNRHANARPDQGNYSVHGYQSENVMTPQYSAPPPLSSSRVHQDYPLNYTAFGGYGHQPEPYINHQFSNRSFSSYVRAEQPNYSFDSGARGYDDYQPVDFNRHFSAPPLSTSRAQQDYPYTASGNYVHQPETYINHQFSTRPFGSHVRPEQPKYSFDSGARGYDDYQTEDSNEQFSDPQLSSTSSFNQASGRNRDMARVNDEYLKTEHGKLKFRIMKLFEASAPSAFSKNLSRFENNDWLKVFCTNTDGLRAYQAKIVCPLCYGKVTPQNTEKIPGMTPNWQLFAVKRHLTSLHKEQKDEAVVVETVVKEDSQTSEGNMVTDSLKTKGSEPPNSIEPPNIDTENQTPEADELKVQPNNIDKLKRNKELKKRQRERSDSSSSWSSSSSSTSSSNSSESSESGSVVVGTKRKSNDCEKRVKKYQKKKRDVKPKSRPISVKNESTGKMNLTTFSSQVCVANMRNLMQHTTAEIINTFLDHEKKLRKIYNEEIKQLKKNFKPLDLPDMIVLDIVNVEQMKEMANLAEIELAKGENNSTDVIFDAILPEWALAAFCKKYNCSRTEAIRTIQKQNEHIIENEEPFSMV